MRPELFRENRVWRAYQGGGGISLLKKQQPEMETHFPEDWIASCVEACNDQYRKAGHGLSTLSNGTLFPEYLARDPEKTLGEKHVGYFGIQPGFLMKILDSAERLPIQVHPTVADAKKYYHSEKGKTECWIVLATREINGQEPYLLLGFNETADRDIFLDDAAKGDFSRSEKMLHKWEVKAGDVFTVPGGVPHAIGPGVTVIEVMEPSDWVVQSEHFCGAQPLTEADRFGPLDMETALKIFHFDAASREAAQKSFCPFPVLLDRTDGFTLSAVVPQKDIKLFEVQALTGQGQYTLVNRESCCRAGVVTEGEFQISTASGSIKASVGESFFLPACINAAGIGGKGKIIFALPLH